MTPFDPNDTVQSKFYVSKRRSVQVPMMSLEDLYTPYFRDKELSCTVVELRYTSNDSMLLILPDQGKMKEVEAALLPETLRRWRGSLQMRYLSPGPRATGRPHSSPAPCPLSTQASLRSRVGVQWWDRRHAGLPCPLLPVWLWA